MDLDDTVGVLGAELERHTRTLKSGAVKARYAVVIKSEKLAFNYNEKTIARGPAQAIVNHLRDRIQSVSTTVSKATMVARDGYKRALDAGKSWATKRYAGGRTGAMEPATSDRMFNDSGRLAKTLYANSSSDGSWRVNVAANRLNPDTLDGRGARGGESALSTIWGLLVSLVPELENVELLLDVLPVRAALDKAVDEMTTKLESGNIDLLLERFRAGVELLADVDELLAG